MRIDIEKIITQKGRVLITDDDSVTLDKGSKEPVDIEYRAIRTLQHPAKDQWLGSLSTGTFSLLVPQAEEFDERLSGVGAVLRKKVYSGQAIEANVSIGGKGKGQFSTWISTTTTAHFYTYVSRVYFLFGGGVIWPMPSAEFKSDYPRNLYRGLIQIRTGFGMTNPVSRRLNVRMEAELIGFQIYLEGRLN